MELYNKLRLWGNPWGNSPSSDVVLVPDLRGRFIRGNNDQSGRDPDNAKFGQPQDDTFASHNHGVNQTSHRHAIQGNGYSAGANQPNADVVIDDDIGSSSRTSLTDEAVANISIQPAGHAETRPKNINLTPVIKL